jgi:acyl-CoA synthetase (AMP-forming)/AMP-acid ligase II
MSTLYEMFTQSVEKFGPNPCLGKRVNDGPYQWMTYQEVADEAAHIAAGLATLGVGSHARAGIYGANCPEWMVSMQACNRMGIYCVPLYDTLGETAIEYIIHHSEASVVFTQSEKFPMLLKALPMVKDRIKTVVYWGPENAAAAEVRLESSVETPLLAWPLTTDVGVQVPIPLHPYNKLRPQFLHTPQSARALGITVYTYADFVALGQTTPVAPTPPAPEDLAPSCTRRAPLATPRYGLCVGCGMGMCTLKLEGHVVNRR